MKRYSLRGICKSRVYTYKSAARIVGVSLATFRKWPKEGLQVITDKRPYLVRGADLIDFLTKRMARNRHPMEQGQFLCMSCKGPRHAASGSIGYLPQTNLTGRLSALCGACGGKVGRFCSTQEARELGQIP